MAEQTEHTDAAPPDEELSRPVWRCVACGDPCREGQRWCSRSCYAIENCDPEGAYE